MTADRSSNGPIPVASVHGRFQPFHLQHLDYLEVAFRHAEFLYIGLTQPSLTDLSTGRSGPEHRAQRSSNPLTYFERETLITKCLVAAGYTVDRFTIVPFPIERPESLWQYLPTIIPILTTRVDDWNDEKISRLERLGYQVTVLFERDPKEVSGNDIRSLLTKGDLRWRSMVPEAAADLMIEWQLADRLRAFESSSC